MYLLKINNIIPIICNLIGLIIIAERLANNADQLIERRNYLIFLTLELQLRYLVLWYWRDAKKCF